MEYKWGTFDIKDMVSRLEDKPLLEYVFESSTFFIQNHGLSLKRLNKKNAVKIISMIRNIQPFNGKVVVA